MLTRAYAISGYIEKWRICSMFGVKFIIFLKVEDLEYVILTVLIEGEELISIEMDFCFCDALCCERNANHCLL